MFHPIADLQYEHVFSSNDTQSLSRSFFTGLRLIRSFLLLEDDHNVDWEVDGNEPTRTLGCGARPARWGVPEREDHPHRVALRSRLGARRPGLVVPREQVCLCPLPARSDRSTQRDSRIATGSVREVIDR
jgi:hypothetical protein